MTTISRHLLCWITAVYWLFVGAAEVSGSYDSASCSREGRSFQPRPQVPCDLVKNTFCDTSGDSYPWSQLRKFVFENQGLIKRMYGYQTHYAILKDELLDMLDGADQLMHDPLEMYRADNQFPDPDEKLQSSRVRNSVRSNAFRGRTLDDANESNEDRLRGVGGQSSEAQKELFDRATLLEDYGEVLQGEAAEEDPDRRRNERHLDARSPSSRAMRLSKSPPPNSGRRSISSSSFIKDQLNGDKLEGFKRPYESKERVEEEKLADSDRLSSIKITQSYSTKATSEGRFATQASSSTAAAVDHVDEAAREDGITEVAPASEQGPPTSSPSSAEATLSTPGVSQETTLRYSEELVRPTGPQGSLHEVSSTSYEVTTTAPDEPLDADEWVTAGPSAYVYASRESSDEGSTVSVSSTATRPPVSHSPTSVEPPLLYTTLPSVEAEEPTTTFTFRDSSEPDDTTSIDESITADSNPVKVSAKYKEAEKQPTHDHLLSESLTVEQRTSEGLKLNSYNIHEGAIVKTTQSSFLVNSEEHVFRFPDEVEVSVPILAGFNPNEDEAAPLQQDQKQSSNNSRRQSNTRRPASAESRQPSHNRRRPSESWTTPEGQENSTLDVDDRNPTRPFSSPSRSPPGRGTATIPPSDSRLTGGIVPGVVRNPGGGRPQQQQQAMWRRPDLDEAEQTTTTTTTTSNRPPPPTPSTVPTPSHTVHFKKGVNACPVETDVVAPYWANNTRGEVLALLNLAPFEQYVHWEKCRFEYRQMYCRPGCRCEQQYRLHRMLAFDPSNDCRGIFSDWFRFPSGCVCKCYDLPEEIARSAAAYNRSPRVSDNLEDDGFTNDEEKSEETASNFRELKSLGTQGRAHAAVGDLSDVYFESEDDLLPLGASESAQDRMDEGFSYEQFISSEDDDAYASPSTVNNIRRDPVKDDDENIKEMRNKIVDDVVKVLEREPVHSLYSRAESAQSKPKVPLASITPQRRPRPHVLSQRRTSGFSQPVQQLLFKMPNQPHGYNLRFGQSTRVLQYSPPNVVSPLSHFQYQQNQMARNRYVANNPRYRSLNIWNPQASFPATLSNPRFKKYLDNDAQANPHQLQSFQDSPAGSNNLNLNHLMKPGPPVAPILPSTFAPTPPPSEGSAVTYGTLDVNTPHYYFNLTSHLIRTQQLDDRRIGSSNIKSREPRSLKPGEEPSLTEERIREDDRNSLG